MGANATYTAVTHKSLHEALCSDGDDACGGPFEHKRGIDEVVMAAIANIDAMRAAAASTSVTEPAGIDATHTNAVADDVDITQPTAIDDGFDRPFEVCITRRPKIKATATKPGKFQTSLELTHQN
jgi:hypothetical protein